MIKIKRKNEKKKLQKIIFVNKKLQQSPKYPEQIACKIRIFSKSFENAMKKSKSPYLTAVLSRQKADRQLSKLAKIFYFQKNGSQLESNSRDLSPQEWMLQQLGIQLSHRATGTKPNKKQTDDSPKKHKNCSWQKKGPAGFEPQAFAVSRCCLISTPDAQDG